jgi:pimeloyl-ACP methyl ester carboxylesterase
MSTRSGRLISLLLVFSLLGGCAGVKVSSLSTADYIAQRRGDVLSSGQLSRATLGALQVVGVVEPDCVQRPQACRDALVQSAGLAEEQRLAALAELWLQQAVTLQRGGEAAESRDAAINAYLESARQAYAYLFFSRRQPGERAFEDRQTQVRDYYNFAVQQAITGLFQRYRGHPPSSDAGGTFHIDFGRWQIGGDMAEVRLAEGRELPKELVPAASLSFAGLRNQYRRDGLGAELVSVSARRVVNRESAEAPWSETPFPALTGVMSFPGTSLAEVLATRKVVLNGYDPYRRDSVQLAGVEVPLAANFTSGYGLWLARSGFAQQSLLTLVGRGEVLEKPRVYLLQPYDPNRRVVVMLHGLASSPEAWINVANEVLGDEALRRNYQIWQVYYPTNLPLAINNWEIREALQRTLRHFDPQGNAKASRDMVLVGHSMGGVLSRLMVSSSGESLWQHFSKDFSIDGERLRKVRGKLGPFLHFEPLPQVSRAVFLAAPHRGTPFAENRLSRWAAGLVRLPVSVLERIADVGQLLVMPGEAPPAALTRPLNSIDNLSENDPFVRSSSQLPISPRVRYHSIIGNDTPNLAQALSSDGVVPYSSSHLQGADSEIVVRSWHSVQETPQAILEIRRILRLHLQGLDDVAPAKPSSASR